MSKINLNGIAEKMNQNQMKMIVGGDGLVTISPELGIGVGDGVGGGIGNTRTRWCVTDHGTVWVNCQTDYDCRRERSGHPDATCGT